MNATATSFSLKKIALDFKEITKAGLAVSVVFSSIAGYLLGVLDFQDLKIATLLMLAIGGYCMVGASNAFNQVIEKDLDALMDRTKNRPVASGRMSPNHALFIASLLTIIGLILLSLINPKSAMFGAISIFLYTSVYTPLKQYTPLSVFVGAFPGAIPFMLGWVAATDNFGIEAGTLFLIQFFWQFPHFWAIAWVSHDDYQRAGFFMLPSKGGRDKSSRSQILVYTLSLFPIALTPFIFNFTGWMSATVVSCMGLVFIIQAYNLYKSGTIADARKLMFGSFIYLPLVQLALMVGRLFLI